MTRLTDYTRDSSVPEVPRKKIPERIFAFLKITF